MSQHRTQPWIKDARFDSVFILLPPFLSLLVVCLLPGIFKSTSEMPLSAWVILVLFIDVAHVYSTLFRTYFNPARFNSKRSLMVLVPILCYLVGVLLHGIDGLLFWRVLAYLAVFHFVRQQYGFMRLYSRGEDLPRWSKQIDTLAIYSATIYPIIYWHCHPDRNFNWFVDGDFLLKGTATVSSFAAIVYYSILSIYFFKELFFISKKGSVNIPRNLLIIGTTVSWYFGIIYFNGDLAFTLLNVVAHGIPYMALIWTTGKKEELRQPKNSYPSRMAFVKKYGAVFFILSLVALAYLEEGLWDGLIWREHHTVFGIFSALPSVDNHYLLALLVPLLALPQSTHYVLDAFIWRRKDG
ncbi:hypothetical protein [Taibaiella soli]|uniref:Uncharacterized protein n=1 Tax=Taibaiella soli TaxID=1649169 RepID=A0A2W2AQZ5_9BACT|nr:hypothetical protein [Taibaiella soli]PZF74850.1 hypothetical protein DN068_01240 [Taibaiella soli]